MTTDTVRQVPHCQHTQMHPHIQDLRDNRYRATSATSSAYPNASTYTGPT